MGRRLLPRTPAHRSNQVFYNDIILFEYDRRTLKLYLRDGTSIFITRLPPAFDELPVLGTFSVQVDPPPLGITDISLRIRAGVSLIGPGYRVLSERLVETILGLKEPGMRRGRVIMKNHGSFIRFFVGNTTQDEDVAGDQG